MNWYWGDNDVEKEPPKDGFFRILYLLGNFPGKMILINVVFLLSCLPIVTIPAAHSAMSAFVGKMYRDGFDFSLDNYKREFSGRLWKQLPLGLFSAAIIFYGYYLMSLAGNFKNVGDTTTHGLLLGCGGVFFCVGLLLNVWISVLSATLELKNHDILKNAAILFLIEWKRSAGILITSVIFLFLTFTFLPYSLILLLLIEAVLYWLICYELIDPVIQERIVKPYEDLRKGECP